MLINFTFCTSTARPAASYITSSPDPNITALSMLNFKNESLTTEQVLLERSDIPAGKPNKRAPFEEMTAAGFSAVSSPLAQAEGSSFNFQTGEMSKSQSGNSFSEFDGDTATSINATVTDLSSNMTDAHEEEYQQFSSTRGSKDQRKQIKLKWIWKD